MISKLTGTIAHSDPKYIILDVGGVGYKVHTTSDTAFGMGEIGAKKTPGANTRTNPETITLWTHLAVRDDALDLYGFTSREELDFFELLITISGIGPKTALGILNVASIEALDSAIRNNDITHLVKVAGLGRKIAEKIVRELQDKMEGMDKNPAHHSVHDAGDMRNESDALEALKSLGYSHSEARTALREVDKKIKDTGAKVKEALKILGK
jgi:Holliday junction DNA helicase RuvA